MGSVCSKICQNDVDDDGDPVCKPSDAKKNNRSTAVEGTTNKGASDLDENKERTDADTELRVPKNTDDESTAEKGEQINSDDKAQNETDTETSSVSASAVNGSIASGCQFKDVKAEDITYNVENETRVHTHAQSSATSDKKKEKPTAPTQTAKADNGGIVCSSQFNDVEAEDIIFSIKNKKIEHAHAPSPDTSDETNDKPKGQTQTETQNLTGSSVQNRRAVSVPQFRNDPAQGGKIYNINQCTRQIKLTHTYTTAAQ
ncbi:uncharacterized protein LOC115423351 [Sphaeramia orbicularis]|uniref:uncharacterized protein LOC115423351 n=1 Tax=Sphaeramia orbicularis TaxID=375764 RepID=UPI00117C2F68|nr:uncharacterized protein LOC115423351 [Sphaeramia orbicularis]